MCCSRHLYCPAGPATLPPPAAVWWPQCCPWEPTGGELTSCKRRRNKHLYNFQPSDPRTEATCLKGEYSYFRYSVNDGSYFPWRAYDRMKAAREESGDRSQPTHFHLCQSQICFNKASFYKKTVAKKFVPLKYDRYRTLHSHDKHQRWFIHTNTIAFGRSRLSTQLTSPSRGDLFDYHKYYTNPSLEIATDTWRLHHSWQWHDYQTTPVRLSHPRGTVPGKGFTYPSEMVVVGGKERCWRGQLVCFSRSVFPLQETELWANGMKVPCGLSTSSGRTCLVL